MNFPVPWHKVIQTRKSRYAKPWLRDMKKSYIFQRLLWGLTLKPGEVVYSYLGYNEKIEDLIPCWEPIRRTGRILMDIDIVIEGQLGHFALGYDKPKTKAEIIETMKDAVSHIGLDCMRPLTRAILTGEALNEDGTLNSLGRELRRHVAL